MTFFPLSLPPGIYKNGTQLQSQGRWYDGNLVRFYSGTIRPVGGWRQKSTTTMTGSPRAMISWRDNGSTARCAVATHSHIYYMTKAGVLSDITPVGYTAGRADAVAVGGFGSGLYGVGIYGAPIADSTDIQDATVNSLDTWGEDLVFCGPDDTKIYQWNLNTAVLPTQVTNSPTATSLLVTQEGILMAFGAESVPRRVKWSDQRNNTLWAPDATNQAGDFDLQTNGRIMFGLRVNGGILVLTDMDVHLGTYTGDNRIYAFDKKSDGCGAISRASGIALDSQAVWMGNGSFWIYNGFASPLPCDVSDYVFSDFNYLQQSKVTCELNSEFGEVKWHYPSGGSVEIDRYVTWNFRENHWSIGQMPRLCGADRGVAPYPLKCGSDGYVYEHEVANDYGTMVPFLEGGPLLMGNGDNVFYAQQIVPDDKTVGDVTATFKTRFYPDDADTSYGPYTLSSHTDVRFGGRQMRVRFDGAVATDWRIGTPRIDVTQGGGR
jgi:hypothetical protein